MRATVPGVCAACALLTTPCHASVRVPADADAAALMQIQAIQDRTRDRSADRWRGRHHYLYDDEYQPNSDTVGAAASDARACAREPIRLRRSDGSTVVRHVKRCK